MPFPSLFALAEFTEKPKLKEEKLTFDLTNGHGFMGRGAAYNIFLTIDRGKYSDHFASGFVTADPVYHLRAQSSCFLKRMRLEGLHEQ